MPPKDLPKNLIKEILAGAQHLGLILSTEQAHQLAIYAEILLEWNQKINLISHKAESEIVARHIVDSLAPWAYLSGKGLVQKKFVVADLGSGGGFPGIPLKIAAPHWKMTLIEPTLKKCIFLKEVIQRLGLENTGVAAYHIDEHSTPPELFHRFDLVVSRATLPFPKLFPTAKQLLNTSGQLIAMVSRKQAAAENNLESWPYELPDGSAWALLVSKNIEPSGS